MMPRFVVLRHDLPNRCPRDSHWDLMLEESDSLLTWAIAEIPRPGMWVKAEPLPEHRIEYLDYEGPVSNDRGMVKQWDRGEFDWVEATDTRIEVRLRGEQLNGTAKLHRPSTAHGWRLMIDSK